MVIQYSATPSNLTQALIPDEGLISIGHLVRAFAEIDDLILLYICGLAEINESCVVVLLGRAPGAATLDMAETLTVSGRATI